MITLVTSNLNKAKQAEKYLGMPLAHQGIDLPEIQSLDVQEIVEAKAREAYTHIGAPVIVDDSGVSFEGLNGLPGPFIKWFEVALGGEKLCRMVDPLPNRNATVYVALGYFDGTNFAYFKGEGEGSVADHPRGDNGFGFDVLFVHTGDERTHAELTTDEQDARSIRKKAYDQLRTHLATTAP